MRRMRLLKWLIIVIVLLLALSFILPFFSPFFASAESAAGGPPIRVALFLQTDKGPTLPTADSVTLTAVDLSQNERSDYTLSVHFSGVSLGPSASDRSAVRVSLNGYRLRLAETKEATRAYALAQALAAQKLEAVLTAVRRGNETVYRLESAAYATLSQLAAVEGTYRQIAQSIDPTSAPKRVGPYAVLAGQFDTYEAAEAKAAVYRARGFDAYPAYRLKGGQFHYAVVVGGAVDEAGRIALLSEFAAAYPDVAYEVFAPSDAVIISERDVFLGAGAGTLERLRIPLAGELTVSSAAGGVRIDEKKGGQAYRGAIALSAQNGRLAAINVVPLEHYLYGVVGAEMSAGWPLEALKAQAVLARTYALGAGNKYGVANLSDTTYDQAYDGIAREAPDVRKAVDATAGEVLTVAGRLVQALYSSNAGGMSAHGAEVWGNDVPYLKPVASPDDAPLMNAPVWYRIARADGTIGYVHGDYVRETGATNAAGFAYGMITAADVNFRPSPGTERAPIGKLQPGEYVVLLEKVRQNNAYRWIDRPYNGAELMAVLNARLAGALPFAFTQPIERLSVAERGPSGRVVAVNIDGFLFRPSSPDSFRSYFVPPGEAGLRSTKFEIEAYGDLTVLGAGGTTRALPEKNALLAAVQAGGKTTTGVGAPDGQIVIMGGKGNAARAGDPLRTGAASAGSTATPAGTAPGGWAAALTADFRPVDGEGALAPEGTRVRVAALVPMFRFAGFGYGHGLGLSQYGAKALAEQGATYAAILRHYFGQSAGLSKTAR
ncbi:MAG: SpoIID/LytB domain-containing protein [Hydrogenibacillus sp.]|nr:SpoIID/LytB domain-containing protein [Hydrogenibacillus sp.]